MHTCGVKLIFVYVCPHTFFCLFVNKCVYVCLHSQAGTYMQTFTHVCMYVCIYLVVVYREKLCLCCPITIYTVIQPGFKFLNILIMDHSYIYIVPHINASVFEHNYSNLAVQQYKMSCVQLKISLMYH